MLRVSFQTIRRRWPGEAGTGLSEETSVDVEVDCAEDVELVESCVRAMRRAQSVSVVEELLGTAVEDES